MQEKLGIQKDLSVFFFNCANAKRQKAKKNLIWWMKNKAVGVLN